MKRTCDRCKALTYTDYFRCSLGYKTTVKTEYMGYIVEIKPIEDCPKPKTYNEYIKNLRDV